MTIYHLSVKIISRGKGKSAVAAAAYRSGEKIKNEYDGMIHDYTRKGGVIHTEILLPENAPPEFSERAVLWNEVEKIEKAKNSQLAREIELALPAEFNYMQNVNLVREYVKKNFVDEGMCADVCIHDKKDSNPHAHIMLTMRPFNEDRTWGTRQKKEYILDNNGDKIYDKKKRQYKCKSIPTTDWNEQTKAEEWRQAWADTVNEYLRLTGNETRIDHRSYERQGIDKIPSIHLGVAAHQMEQRGIRTERGNINREIEVTNKRLQQIKARINKLQKWLDVESTNTEPPTLAYVIQNILANPSQKSRYQLKFDLQTAAKMFNFLQENNITDLTDLENKLRSMIDKQFIIRDKLKPIDRRMETLDKHFNHSENFKQYRGHKAQYVKLYAEYKTLKKSTGFFSKQKAQKALDTFNEYAETHRRELTFFDTAEQYLKDVLQAHFDPKKLPPIKKWKIEYAELLSQKSALNNDYKNLKDETREVEIIRKNVEQILRSKGRKTPKRDMER